MDMNKTITIDPVTRIEGHAKITIHLDDEGLVDDARFHVTEFRGFEKFCEGTKRRNRQNGCLVGTSFTSEGHTVGCSK